MFPLYLIKSPVKKSIVNFYISSLLVNKRRVIFLTNTNTWEREHFTSRIYFFPKLFEKSHSQEHCRLEYTRYWGNNRQNGLVLNEKWEGWMLSILSSVFYAGSISYCNQTTEKISCWAFAVTFYQPAMGFYIILLD